MNQIPSHPFSFSSWSFPLLVLLSRPTIFLRVIVKKAGWQKLATFGEGKNGPYFRQARICYFRDKCVDLREIT